MSKLSPQDWDAYWNTAVITSVEESFPDNYDLEILDYWQKVLTSDLKHVIDLACGNGALVWIADQTLNKTGAKARITGVDIANITPFKTLRKDPANFPNIRFIGNTSMDQLPFNDNSIDMAISQWGLEYSDLTKTIPELGRVLKPQAKMAFICHHESSYILQDSRLKEKKFNILLNHGDIHKSYLALNDLYNSHKTVNAVKSDPTYSRITGEINRILLEIRYKLHATKDPSVQSAEEYLQFLAALFPSSGKSKNLSREKDVLNGKSQLEATKARIDDLLNAALSSDDCTALIGLIENEGFTVRETGKLMYKEKINVGTALIAERY
jgi:ubiquinone/menaquinone biosynthesis C-methylase UbiE